MSARVGSAASSRGSGSMNNIPGSNATSRRYRRVANSPQVDDTLFGDKNQAAKSRKNQRSLQAGRCVRVVTLGLLISAYS